MSLGVSGTPRAQADDRAYCESLYAIWEHYIAPIGRGRFAGGFEAVALVDQCRRGNTAGGIPGLERILRNNRFTLPSR